MRRTLPVAATAVLLAGPTVLAFFSGGYFDGPRAAAAAIAWALVLVVALVGPLPVASSVPGRVALAALVGLVVWSAISLTWAPLAGPAIDVVQRLLLYTGALLAALALLRDARAARAVEPVLALGALLVVGYGLSGRLLPGLIDLSRSQKAGGRLEQPITYWNSEGLLAAIGLILCVRIAGDSSRSTPIRTLAAAACAPLGMGVYLSYSRGAALVAVIGLIVLLAAAPSRTQLRAAITGLLAGITVSACSAAFRGVASLEGSGAAQERDGAIMLATLLAVMLTAGLFAAQGARAERRDPARLRTLRHARRLPALAGVAGMLCVAGLVAGGLGEHPDPSQKAEQGPSRLASVNSSRYEYWRVGVLAFGEDPLKGVGAGGYRVVWRMERRSNEGVKEVHSVVLEMGAELGVPGLLLFGLFIGGVATAGRRALRDGAPIAAGACAACSVWLMHAIIDWDLQLPAVTLPALVLAGALLAAGERASPPPAAEPADEVARESGLVGAARA